MQSKSAIKTLAWLAAAGVVSALAVVCATQRQTIADLRAQQFAQEEQVRELERLRSERQAAPPGPDQSAELERLRENTKDLLRLRNEVTQLRSQLQELEVLRAANAQLLRAVQGAGIMSSNQLALITAARKLGAVLGVHVQAPASGQPGVEVVGLAPDSPVVTSGVAVGDIIFALDGQRVASPADLQAQMLTRRPGETVVVDVLRTNAVLRFQVRTREYPQ